VCRAAKIDGDQ